MKEPKYVKYAEEPHDVRMPGVEPNKETIKKSLLFTTNQNINRIFQQLQEGAAADKEALVVLINTMLQFVNYTVRPKEQKNDSEVQKAD
jgi:hypothetical protein